MKRLEVGRWMVNEWQPGSSFVLRKSYLCFKPDQYSLEDFSIISAAIFNTLAVVTEGSSDEFAV